jgi:protein-disulfide isomerase
MRRFLALAMRHLFLLTGCVLVFALSALETERYRTAARTVTLSAPAVVIAMPGDVSIGQTDAPHVIVALVSMTCGHCQRWEKETLPSVVNALVDTGEARLVIRPFPLDRAALSAAVFIACQPEMTRVAAQRAMMASDGAWVGGSLSAYMRASGANPASKSTVQKCLDDGAMRRGVLNSMLQARRSWGASVTPTFVIGRYVLPGEMSEEALKASLRAEADVPARRGRS